MLLERVVLWLPSVQRQITVHACYAIVVFRAGIITPASSNHLKLLLAFSTRLAYSIQSHLCNLALPSLFLLIWPCLGKSSSSRFCELLAHGILTDESATARPFVDRGIDSPAAVRRMFEMFFNRIVAIFPSVELSVAAKAHTIVVAVAGGLVEKSGAC
jgi:hypothetical protein